MGLCYILQGEGHKCSEADVRKYTHFLFSNIVLVIHGVLNRAQRCVGN